MERERERKKIQEKVTKIKEKGVKESRNVRQERSKWKKERDDLKEG